MTALAYLSWLEAAARIRTGNLSPVAYVEALLDRISAHDGSLNAFIRVEAEQALASAREAERSLARGAALGPMHGVAYALKDIIDVEGLPTTAHSKILRENVAGHDAEVTRRLKGAGGILLGKLATHEFAIGGPCFDLPWPPARNPWDPSRHPGGSSSGSGVAVAAGFVPIAIGSDTGGSVRNPASTCGIVGMKPTYGRISLRGVVPLAWSLDTLGPMTRTVAENAALLNLIVDPPATPAVAEDFTRHLGKGLGGLRIGVVRHFYTRDAAADAAIIAGMEDALEILASEGAEVVEVVTRSLDEFVGCNRVLLTSEAYAVHERWLQTRPEDYAALTRNRLLVGAFFRAVDYIQATRLRRELTAALDEAMAGVDVIVTASSLDPPCRIDDSSEIERTYPRHARTPFNVSGHPVLAMPCGFTASGLPLSFQIAARAYDEATIYRVANAYEQVTPWKDRHPLPE